MSEQLCAAIEIIAYWSLCSDSVSCGVKFLVLSIILLPFHTSPFIRHNGIITLFKSLDIYMYIIVSVVLGVGEHYNLCVPSYSLSWPCCVTL